MDVPVVVGGIVPVADRPMLLEAGVSQIFGPGDAIDDILSQIAALLAQG
jgi:methylmalonyl-CoA mutase cobalamin-binding domain/chain